MRRSDRAIVKKEEIENILLSCKVCRLAMIENNQPYIVPLNFGYTWDDELILYFHGAKQGRKIDAMKINKEVCFEMDCDHELIPGDYATDYSYGYRSIIGYGKISFKETMEEKRKALEVLMLQQANMPKHLIKKLPYENKWVDACAVFTLKVTSLQAKGQIVKKESE